MNPWAHIDQLKTKLAAEKAAAVEKLKALKFKGDVASRLEFDGTHWVFPVSGSLVKSRTLDGLITTIADLQSGTKVRVKVVEMDLTITEQKGGAR